MLSSRCNISLQEYQSKKLLEEAGLNIQRFQMASSPDQAHEAGKVLCISWGLFLEEEEIFIFFLSFSVVDVVGLVNTIAKELVIKAQILAGGRGRGTFSSGLQGGVKLTKK